VNPNVSPSFADLGVPAHITASLAARRIDAPFPIQAATIPDGLAGRDLCGRAPTGSGKTIAFGIPMVVALTEGTSKPKRPRGLVLVPTRELASQVCQELQLLGKPRGPWVEAFYGGVGFDKQVRALQRGVDIMVACPGRLADLINQRLANLEDVEFVVIDEADRMADMGFLPEVRRLLDQCNTQRQTVLFSATLDGDVDVLIKKYQHNPAKHEFIADDEGGAKAEHLFWRVERADRVQTAAAIIDKLGPTVVFCRTKRGADRIAKQLDALGVKSAAIHGDRSQKQREFALAQFHRGKVKALVATDVAARGIHVDNVAGVIHFDPPGDPKDYVHRSGRTARAGARGVVISLVPGELRKAVADIQKDLGYPVGLAAPDLASLVAGDAPLRPTTYDERAERPSRPRVERPRGERPRTDRSRPERSRDGVAGTRPARTERPAPTVWTDRPADVETVATVASGASAEWRKASAGAEATTPASRATAERTTSEATPAPVARRLHDGPARPPLAEGQRRPSGAARRKAKKLAAAERAVLEVDKEGWTSDDLFDGRSGRPDDRPRHRDARPGSNRAAKPKPGKTGSGRGKAGARAAARGPKPTEGRTPAAPRSKAGPARGAKPSGRSGPGGSRQAARSGSSSGSSSAGASRSRG
jgi:superfamily II DNA/RNA helicase